MNATVYVVQIKVGNNEPAVEAVFMSKEAAESSWAISYSRCDGELTFVPISSTETSVMYQAEGADKPVFVGVIYCLPVNLGARHL